jgi:hypothetical protein
MKWWRRNTPVTITPEVIGQAIPDGDTVPVDGVRWIELLPTQELPVVREESRTCGDARGADRIADRDDLGSAQSPRRRPASGRHSA